MVKELSSSTQYRDVCKASDGRGSLEVTVGTVPFLVRCAHAKAACEATDTFTCRGIQFELLDSDQNGKLYADEANKGLASTLPQHVEKAGWIYSCAMSPSGTASASCFAQLAGAQSFLRPGEEFISWLRCVFKSHQLSEQCVKKACEGYT
mmetsp:Transcript_29643/g.59594  ORF Transcript_29643/g.59594 Transcript_29643/m.59594 type:complete len:150 (-) Transcript_29643:64-513(-)